jgi:hypothetical protein
MTWGPGKERVRQLVDDGEVETPGPSPDDVRDAIEVASQVRNAVATILDQDVLTVW